MKSLYGILAISLLVIGLTQVPVAEAVSCVNCKVKVVVRFEHSATLEQIQTTYTDNARPALVSLFQDFLNNNNFTVTGSYIKPSSESVYISGFNSTSGKTVYEIYPEAGLTASNDQTKSEFDIAWDIFLAQTRTSILNYLQTNNAENVTTHIDYSWGGADVDEGF